MVKIVRDNATNAFTDVKVKFGCKKCGLIYYDIGSVQITKCYRPITGITETKYTIYGRCPDCFNLAKIVKYKSK